MLQTIVQALYTIPLLLFAAVLGLGLATLAVRLFDAWLLPQVDFSAELRKQNSAVGIVVGALVFGVFYLIAQAVA